MGGCIRQSHLLPSCNLFGWMAALPPCHTTRTGRVSLPCCTKLEHEQMLSHSFELNVWVDTFPLTLNIAQCGGRQKMLPHLTSLLPCAHGGWHPCPCIVQHSMTPPHLQLPAGSLVALSHTTVWGCQLPSHCGLLTAAPEARLAV